MQLLTYNDIEIQILQATHDPYFMIERACETTMKQFPSATGIDDDTKMEKLIRYLVKAEHTSVFEHIIITVDIRNVSRSFLAQITRHRMGSFTSSSQHYQDYSEYPMMVHPKYIDDFTSTDSSITMVRDYNWLIDRGVPKEEARQILPNAAAVNLLWTVNMRSLMNFFRQRCCNRNTAEMQLFANRLRGIIVRRWPMFHSVLGPMCVTSSQPNACTQGHMRCKQMKWSSHERI